MKKSLFIHLYYNYFIPPKNYFELVDIINEKLKMMNTIINVLSSSIAYLDMLTGVKL